MKNVYSDWGPMTLYCIHAYILLYVTKSYTRSM